MKAKLKNKQSMADYKMELLLMSLSAAGGIAKYAKEYLDGVPFDGKRLIATIIMSSFAGLMFGYFGQSLGLKENVLFMFAGVGGFAGSESLNYLYGMITKRKE